MSDFFVMYRSDYTSLSFGAAALLALFCSRARYNGAVRSAAHKCQLEVGQFVFGSDEIAKLASVSRPTVDRWVKELEKHEHIMLHRKKHIGTIGTIRNLSRIFSEKKAHEHKDEHMMLHQHTKIPSNTGGMCAPSVPAIPPSSLKGPNLAKPKKEKTQGSQLLDKFSAAWQSRYGASWIRIGAGEAVQAKALAEALGERVSEVGDMIDRFLADDREYYVKSQHTFFSFVKDINQFAVPKPKKQKGIY